MYESFLIVFREVIEMALIVGIILVFLKKTKRTAQNNVVYLGIASGLGVSAFLAWLFSFFWGSFTGRAEEIFEGFIMISASLLITTMIFWFFKNSAVQHRLEEKVTKYWDKWAGYGLFSVVFLSVLREGVELVLFMAAVFLKNAEMVPVILSSFGGLFAALFCGYLLFVVGKKLPLRQFFLASNILLILFAAGLLAHGVHELEEAGIIPIIVKNLYDINHFIDEKGAFGGILKALFGYNSNPSLLETLSYVSYIMVMVFAFRRLQTRKAV